MLHVKGTQEEGGFHSLCQGMEFGNYGAALVGDNLKSILLDMDGSQVGGSFHQARDIGRHALYAMRAGQQGGDDIGGISFLDGFFFCLARFADGVYLRVAGGIFGR